MPSWPALRGRVAALKETLLHSGEEIEYHLRVGVPNRKFWREEAGVRRRTGICHEEAPYENSWRMDLFGRVPSIPRTVKVGKHLSLDTWLQVTICAFAKASVPTRCRQSTRKLRRALDDSAQELVADGGAPGSLARGCTQAVALDGRVRAIGVRCTDAACQGRRAARDQAEDRRSKGTSSRFRRYALPERGRDSRDVHPQ